MILCDRCKDIKRVNVQRYNIYNIKLYEHNNFAIQKDAICDDSKIGDIDLCVLCADTLKRKLINAVYTTRQGD